MHILFKPESEKAKFCSRERLVKVKALPHVHSFRTLFFLLAAALCVSCTTIQGQPLENNGEDINFVCIKKNPKVIVRDFEPILEEGFLRHGIKTKVYSEIPPECFYVLTYTATQAWDFVLYMKDARLDLNRGDVLAAYASFHLIGGGGVDLSKWDSTSTKINPLIDQLLSKTASTSEAIKNDDFSQGHTEISQ